MIVTHLVDRYKYENHALRTETFWTQALSQALSSKPSSGNLLYQVGGLEECCKLPMGSSGHKCIFMYALELEYHI